MKSLATVLCIALAGILLLGVSSASAQNTDELTLVCGGSVPYCRHALHNPRRFLTGADARVCHLRWPFIGYTCAKRCCAWTESLCMPGTRWKRAGGSVHKRHGSTHPRRKWPLTRLGS